VLTRHIGFFLRLRSLKKKRKLFFHPLESRSVFPVKYFTYSYIHYSIIIIQHNVIRNVHKYLYILLLYYCYGCRLPTLTSAMHALINNYYFNSPDVSIYYSCNHFVLNLNIFDQPFVKIVIPYCKLSSDRYWTLFGMDCCHMWHSGKLRCCRYAFHRRLHP